MLAVRIPEEMELRLIDLCKKTHRSKSYYVKQALAEFLEERAEIEEAVEAYKEYLSSGKKGLTLDEMKKKYGFD